MELFVSMVFNLHVLSLEKLEKKNRSGHPEKWHQLINIFFLVQQNESIMEEPQIQKTVDGNELVFFIVTEILLIATVSATISFLGLGLGLRFKKTFLITFVIYFIYLYLISPILFPVGQTSWWR